ncbi:hypothetical protein Pcinc_039094 [Petrolisthes cinctipes]|uniref:Uncharacterized protein n=1 Tax=Petrolisthes cinctipes TaxID=88211 RepID=A0AAE1EKY5_PETCI|nr:hypothetical protein Pcinc_039094 [Petrolisthes cinctipes]
MVLAVEEVVGHLIHEPMLWCSSFLFPGERSAVMRDDKLLTSSSSSSHHHHLRDDLTPPGERFMIYWCLLVLFTQLHVLFVLVYSLTVNA